MYLADIVVKGQKIRTLDTNDFKICRLKKFKVTAFTPDIPLYPKGRGFYCLGTPFVCEGTLYESAWGMPNDIFISLSTLDRNPNFRDTVPELNSETNTIVWGNFDDPVTFAPAKVSYYFNCNNYKVGKFIKLEPSDALMNMQFYCYHFESRCCGELFITNGVVSKCLLSDFNIISKSCDYWILVPVGGNLSNCFVLSGYQFYTYFNIRGFASEVDVYSKNQNLIKSEILRCDSNKLRAARLGNLVLTKRKMTSMLKTVLSVLDDDNIKFKLTTINTNSKKIELYYKVNNYGKKLLNCDGFLIDFMDCFGNITFHKYHQNADPEYIIYTNITYDDFTERLVKSSCIKENLLGGKK